MKDKLFSGLRGKIIFNTMVSLLITLVAELFIIFNINLISEFFHKHGYKSSILGREGLSLQAWLLILIVAGGIVFIVSFSLMMDGIVRYVHEISVGMNKIAEGDLNTKISIRGEDEFANMAKNINKMTDDLQDLMEKEREAERSKNDLITNVAHDLRTPLTSIIGYLELLKTKTELAQDVKDRFVDIAYSKSKRLEKLIDDLFSFTKLSHGKIAMKTGQLDIVKLLEQLLDEFYPNFQDAGLYYEFVYKEPGIMIEADGNLLARLFDNLINNAIKYGTDGRFVKVQVEHEDTTVIIQVINYGKEMPQNELEHIFEKFYRVDRSRSMNTGGSGLGLAIAKGIVDLHGGEISVSSGAEGTIFEVRLHESLKK